jgi:hypothetical protein
MMKGTAIACLLLVLGPIALAPAAPVFKDGDVFVFLGDRVTEEYQSARQADRMAYPTHVEAFNVVKYPKMKLRYYNASMDNATAANTLERLDRDVKPLNPTIAVICLGTQEAGMRSFKEETLAAHKDNLTKLVQALKNLGAKVVVLSPASVDEQKINELRIQKYNECLAKWTEAQKRIAEAEGAIFADWFTASRQAREGALAKNQNFYFSHDGLTLSQQAHALAATVLLDALGARPLDFDVVVDWAANTIQSNVEGAELTVSDDGKRTVTIKNLPMPWPTFLGRYNAFTGDWKAAQWCRYNFRMDNPPRMGVMLQQGERKVPMISLQLKEGLNLATIEPLRSLPGAEALVNEIRRKNYTWVHMWRDHMLNPVEQPELAEAQKTLIKAWEQYCHGYEEIIFKMPKTFDYEVVIEQLKLPERPRVGGDEGATPPPPPPPAPAHEEGESEGGES